MRPLTLSEIDAVSGGETVTFELPAGAKVTSTLEANQSTTLNFSFANGYTYSWNSGTFITCFLIGAGVGAAVTAYSGGNTALGSLTGMLAAQACTYAVNSSSGMVDPADGDGG